MVNVISNISCRGTAVKILFSVFCGGLLFAKNASAVETPTGIYFDEVSVTTIVASGYAATPAFSGLETGSAGVNVAKDGVYSAWRNGNTWTTKTAMPTARRDLAVGIIGGKLYAVGGMGLTANEEYNPVTNTWIAKAAIPTGRDGASAAVIGGKLYVIGGFKGGALNTNEEYDPATNSWGTKAVMPTARRDQVMGAIGDKLYVIGGNRGLDVAGDFLNTNEEYDPASNTWNTKAVMPTARHNMAAGVTGGKIYVVGGTDDVSYFNKNEEYNPATNIWTTKTAMPTTRRDLVAEVIGGKLYALGGYAGGSFLNANEEYDPTSNTWSVKAAMSTSRVNMSAGAISGKLYVVGGYISGTEISVNEEYDPGVAHKFTGLTPNTQYSFKAKARDASAIETAESPTVLTYTLATLPVAAPAVFTAVNTTGLTVNWLANGNPAGTLYRAQISVSSLFTAPISSDTYNASATFTGLNLGTIYYARIAAINGNGVVTRYVALGSTATLASEMTKPTGIYFDEVSVTTIVASGYAATPAFSGLETGSAGVTVAMDGTYSSWRNGNKWTAKTAMPTGRGFMSVGIIGGKLYAVGGSNSGGYLNTNEEYDPVSNAWAAKTVMLTSRSGLSVGVVNGKLYAVGGAHASGYVSTNEEYDPIANSWATKAVMPTVRGYVGIGVVGGKLYAVGGYNGSNFFNANEAYDPIANTWSVRAAMPTARDTPVVGVIGGKLYAVGGNYSTAFYTNNEEYNPESDTWSTKAPMPTGRSNFSGGVIGGKIYAVGGTTGGSNYLTTNEEYDPASNTWSTKAVMPAAARDRLAIGVIGGKLYAVGGYNGSSYLGTNEEYDPGVAYQFTGLTPNTPYSFTAKARDSNGIETAESPTVSTYTLAAQPVAAGTVFTAVGAATFVSNWLANGNPSGTLYRAQISASSLFTTVTTSDTYNLSAAFTGLASGTLYYARVAAINGNGIMTAYAALGSVTTTGGVSAMTAPTGVYFDDIFSTSITASGYASAGFPNLQTGSAGVAVAKNGVYSAWRSGGNTWTAKTAMSTARGNLSVGVVGGKLYAVGGRSTGYFGNNEEYDPVSNAWTAKAAMPTARQQFSIGVIGGKLYAVGGNNGSYLDTNEEYDPAANTWAAKAAMPAARDAVSAAVAGGKLYVIGGANSSGLAVNTNYEYNPALNTWTIKSAMPTSRHSLTVGVIAGKLYAVGGDIGGGVLPSINEAYDPISNSWSTKAGVPTGRRSLAAGVVGGKLYALGGTTGGGVYLDTNEEFDPISNMWSTKAVMPAVREGLSVGVIDGRLYALGGYNGGGYLNTNAEYDPGVAASFAGLTPNTQYFFKAKARDSAGIETAESPTVSTYTAAAVPTAGAPVFTLVNAFSFSANWLANGNPSGTLYRAQISASSAFTAVTASDTYDTTASFAGLTSGTTYYARVAAINTYGIITNYLSLGSTRTTGGSVNNAPVLSWTGENYYTADGVNPETGYVATAFIYRVKYTDVDNEMPLAGYPKVHIKKAGAEIAGSPFSMTFVSGGYSTGAIYTYSKTLGTLGTDYTYYFEAQDKNSAAATGAPVTTVTDSPDVVVSGGVTLGEVLDNMALTWTTGGSVNWFGQTAVSNYAGNSAQSGAISNNQESWLQTAVSGPGTLSFYWKVSCEATYDTFVFYIDGVKQSGEISGITDWQQRTFSILAGNHTLNWNYIKDGSVSSGFDSAWVDKVEFSGAAAGMTETRQESFKTTLGDNLFRPRTGGTAKIKFNSPAAGRVSLKIYDLSGRLVRTLYEGSVSAGDTQRDWNGRDDSGRFVIPSVYFLHYVFPGGKEVRKIGVKK